MLKIKNHYSKEVMTLIRKILMILTLMVCTWTIDNEAQAMMSPDELIIWIKELTDVVKLLNEDLEQYERKMTDIAYSDTIGTFVNPAKLGETVEYTFTASGDGNEEVPVTANVTVHDIYVGDDTLEYLNVLANLNTRNTEWVVLDIEVEILTVGLTDAMYTLNARDFQIYVGGSPVVQSEVVNNQTFFESAEVFEGSIFQGLIAREVPRYTDFYVRYGTGVTPTHIFFEFIAEDDPYIVY